MGRAAGAQPCRVLPRLLALTTAWLRLLLQMPFISFSCSILSLLVMASNYAYALDSTVMEQHLSAGAPLLGTFTQSTDPLASWMSTFGDSATIESLSIPGTHDSLACGFSQAKHWPFLILPLVGNVTGSLSNVFQTQVGLSTLEICHVLTDQIRIFRSLANSTKVFAL